MISDKGKPPKPLPKTLNRVTGKYSSQAIGFNDTAWGGQTRSYVKMIHTQLRKESYDKIVAAAKLIAKTTRRASNEEVIDLTLDDKPDEDERAMLVDLPSDGDDSATEDESETEDESKTEDESETEDDSVAVDKRGSAMDFVKEEEEFFDRFKNHGHEMGSAGDMSSS